MLQPHAAIPLPRLVPEFRQVRRAPLRRTDFEQFGYTDNCPGCAHARAGRKQAVDHSEKVSFPHGNFFGDIQIGAGQGAFCPVSSVFNCHNVNILYKKLTDLDRDDPSRKVKISMLEPRRKRRRQEGEGAASSATSMNSFRVGCPKQLPGRRQKQQWFSNACRRSTATGKAVFGTSSSES